MTQKKEVKKYVAFLRGINVGGHHKVPMAELRKEMEKLGFQKVETLLNSGNVVFEATTYDLEKLEVTISEALEKAFGFAIPTLLRRAEMINQLLNKDPFKDVTPSKDIRLYVSFLRNDPTIDLHLPWMSDDNSFKIIEETDKTILSILDLSSSKTPKAMDALERYFGKDITTRNWNTLKRLEKKIN